MIYIMKNSPVNGTREGYNK